MSNNASQMRTLSAAAMDQLLHDYFTMSPTNNIIVALDAKMSETAALGNYELLIHPLWIFQTVTELDSVEKVVYAPPAAYTTILGRIAEYYGLLGFNVVLPQDGQYPSNPLSSKIVLREQVACIISWDNNVV